MTMTLRFVMATSLAFPAALATADEATSIRIGSYIVEIRTGADQPLCRQVLQTIAKVGTDAINQCVPHPQRPETLAMLKPYTGLNWAVIRKHLPPAFAVPDWQKRDLNDPHWHAEAQFLNTLLNLRWEDTPVSRYFSDAEIRQMTEQYARDGTLPFEDGYDHAGEMKLNPGIAFYQAEFEFRGYQQTISRFKYETFTTMPRPFLCLPAEEYPQQSPMFFVEPTMLEAGIVITESDYIVANHFNSDVLTFEDELYHMTSSHGYLKFSRNLPYPDKDPTTGSGHTEICAIKILPQGA